MTRGNTGDRAAADATRPRWYETGPRSRALAIGQWLLIPALVFMEVEFLARTIADANREYGYAQALRTPPDTRVDVLFVGTSQMASAVDVYQFEGAMQAATRRDWFCLNFARGYAPLVQNYLGLRALYESWPDRFDGTVVVIGAPMGHAPLGSWSDPWHMTGWSELLIPLLTPGDLPRMLSTRTPLESRCQMLLGYGLRGSQAVLYHARLRQWMTMQLQDLLTRTGPRGEPDEPALTTDGGVMVDERAQAMTRRVVTEAAERAMLDQQPYPPLAGSLMADLIDLVQANGGQVVVADLPLHSVQARPLLTDRRQQDLQNLTRELAAAGVPRLSVDATFSDSDLPDYSHLDRAARARYTDALARALLESRP